MMCILFLDFEKPLYKSEDLGPLSVLDDNQILPVHKVAIESFFFK